MQKIAWLGFQSGKFFKNLSAVLIPVTDLGVIVCRMTFFESKTAQSKVFLESALALPVNTQEIANVHNKG